MTHPGCVHQQPWRLGHRPALDGIRGAAVVIVIADHAGFLPEPDGGIGVTLFFVLSGFLITRVIVEARERQTWSMAGFVANRFVRLFPALALMVAVVSGILLARGFAVRDVAARAVPALGYLQNMAPRLSFPVFGHTWSLGVEEQFYLLWPLAVPWSRAELARWRSSHWSSPAQWRWRSCSPGTGWRCMPTHCSRAAHWPFGVQARRTGGCFPSACWPWLPRWRWARPSPSSMSTVR